jgi:hypothetical protein
MPDGPAERVFRDERGRRDPRLVDRSSLCGTSRVTSVEDALLHQLQRALTIPPERTSRLIDAGRRIVMPGAGETRPAATTSCQVQCRSPGDPMALLRTLGEPTKRET